MDDFVELRRVINIVLRRWWLVLLATFVAAVIGYAFSISQQPVYQATTSVLVGQSIQATQLDTRDIQTSERLALTYADITRRQPVLEGAIIALGLDYSWEGLRNRVSVKLVPDTQLLEISVEADSREEAALIAGELAQQLILLSPAALQNQRTDDAASFVRQRLQELQTNIEVSESRVNELTFALFAAATPEDKARLQSEIDDLEDKILGWESNYARFLAFVEREQSANYISVVDTARAKRDRIRPNVALNTLIAGAAGFVLAVGLIFLLELLDDTLKTTADISNDLNLATLGTVSSFGGNGSQDKLVVSENPFSPAAESYRMIRNNIEFATMGTAGKSILVTSPTPGDGKSATAINLAIALARNGQKTIIVDADLRRSVLHKTFQVPKYDGLSDQLCRTNPGENIPLHDLKIKGLQLLVAGPAPPNPSELLGSQRMEQLLASLKKQADVVVLDTPPAALLADPIILSGKVDGVILVVSAGNTRREMARQAVFNLQQADANILGAVLNRAPQKRVDRYYQYAHSVEEQESMSVVARLRAGVQRLRQKVQPPTTPDQSLDQSPKKQGAAVGMASILESIPGVGPERQRLLLEHYGSLDNIRQATTDEIAAETGIPHNIAEAVKIELD